MRAPRQARRSRRPVPPSMLFLPSLHGRNPKNAGSAASRGLRRVMDGSGHRDARDACPVSSMHAFQLGERVGCASGVAHAARSPRSRGPDPRQKPRRERREKTRVERRGEAAPEGWCASRGGVDAWGRYAGSMTERLHGDSTRRAPTLAAARPSREHPSSPGTAGSLPPSFVDRGSRDVVDAGARRAADGAMRIRTALGHLSRVLHGSCDTSRSKEGLRVVGVAVFNRVRVCKRIFPDFANPDKCQLSHPGILARVLVCQDYLYFPTNLRLFSPHLHTYGTFSHLCIILRLVGRVFGAQLRHSERHTRHRPCMFSLGLGRFLRGEARKNAKEKKETYEVSPRPFRRAANPVLPVTRC